MYKRYVKKSFKCGVKKLNLGGSIADVPKNRCS